MKVPLSWLKDYVDIGVTEKELEEKLFSCGFEVEEVVYKGKNIDKIVVAKILNIEKHPNADKLSVTKIDAGQYGLLQIVTSAKNIAEGDLVPVALNGATLDNGERIFDGELRGIPSNGMFCSGEELGITDDFYPGASVDGILILKEVYPLGAEVKEALGIGDVIFDINVTANRPDCQSIFGIAREVAAVLNCPLKEPDLSYHTDDAVKTTSVITVENSAPDLCPRYISHYVRDIKIEPSPLWMKRRLASAGLRSINNIVDITNFVLLELGQPMHAFDLNDLEGRKIVVRRAREGEKIVTLDEKSFDLTSDHLVICDAAKPVALAGIMGGLNSEIKKSTEEIVLEAAKFARDNVRKTSRKLGQTSDSSARFEKGIDAYTGEVAMNRALHLIEALHCGTIACDRYDLGAALTEKVIHTTISKINGVLGIKVPAETIREILERLRFVTELRGDEISVTVPPYREDIEDYPDLAEEVIREYGYDHIESHLMSAGKITKGGKTPEQAREDSLKETLCAMGFHEIITYSFVSEREYDDFLIDKASDEHQFVRIKNPLGEDLSVMRTTLLPSVVRVAAKNLNRRNLDGRIFELARVYHPQENGALPIEEKRLSLCVYGEKEDFFTLKGVIESLISVFCTGKCVEFVRGSAACLHPTRSASLSVAGETVVYFGELHPLVAEKAGIDGRVYVGELYCEKMMRSGCEKFLCKAAPKYPAVDRDLALVVDDAVDCGSLVKCIRVNGTECLESVSFFDLYRGAQIGEGKKSLAFNLIFQAQDRTLNVEEVDGIMKNILNALQKECGAALR